MPYRPLARVVLSASAGAALCASANAEERAPDILELRLQGSARVIDALVTRRGDDILVARADLEALGLTPPPEFGPRGALSRMPGLAVRERPAEAAIELICAARCFAPQRLQNLSAPELADDSARASGFFLNNDLLLSLIERRAALQGAFELGVFGPHGYGETRWTSGLGDTDSGARLDSAWTFDWPARRQRLRLGDSITRGGGGGAPVRFGGVQFGTDFSLDPNFITYPTPLVHGQAAAPATVDLYIDGLLRARTQANAGPFSIEEPPVVSGAGVARLEVTDVLGRSQIIEQPFYVSPDLLRAGLSDVAFAAGALRENYAISSADYGDGFVSVLARRGLSNAITGEARIEATPSQGGLGAGLSWISARWGQVDLAGAMHWREDADGGAATLNWARLSRGVSLAAGAAYADADFRRLGETQAAPRLATRLAVSWAETRLGSFSLAFTSADWRNGADVRTTSLTLSPPALGRVQFNLSTGLVEVAGDSSARVSLGLSAPLGEHVMLARSEWDNDGASISARAARRWRGEHGLGYRLAARAGADPRADAALFGATRHGQARLEASHAGGRTGLRAQVGFGLAHINGASFVAMPLRGAFAVVDVGVPNVRVRHDGRDAGRTDLRGRLLIDQLRPHDVNRLSIDIDDLPPALALASEVIVTRPAARGGVTARFPVDASGWIEMRIRDGDGAPLPAGLMMTRIGDGARFPIGAEGRALLPALPAAYRIDARACVIEADREATDLTCAP